MLLKHVRGIEHRPKMDATNKSTLEYMTMKRFICFWVKEVGGSIKDRKFLATFSNIRLGEWTIYCCMPSSHALLHKWLNSWPVTRIHITSTLKLHNFCLVLTPVYHTHDLICGPKTSRTSGWGQNITLQHSVRMWSVIWQCNQTLSECTRWWKFTLYA